MTTTETLGLGIHRADSSEREAVATTIAAGFFDDPVVRWLLPDADRRREILQPLFEVYAAAYLANGETYLRDDASGVAVWLPPNAQLLTPEQEGPFVLAVQDIAGPDAARLFEMEEIFARHHPDGPLYYLQFLATVPGFQGRGIGSAFLREMLERADREGMPAYHEATTPRNRALYERHGYVRQGEFSLPGGGPTLWRMWRDPQPWGRRCWAERPI